MARAITVTLNMQAQQLNDTLSRNLLIDFPGASKPDEVVVIGGHMDSWDLAEGAMDDGVRAMARPALPPPRHARLCPLFTSPPASRTPAPCRVAQ